MPQLSRGILVAIEGIDGSGKSTLARNVAQTLTALQFPIALTQEPGKTGLGKLLKPIVQEKKVPIAPKAEFLLFAADRAQHFNEIIIPALKNNMLIISDRMADSSLVYQGYGRGLDIPMLKTINTWAMQEQNPDLVIYVKVNPEIAYERILKRGEKLSSFEKERETFIKKLSDGFDALLSARDNVIIIDGTLDAQTLTDHAVTKLTHWLKEQRIV